MRIKKAKLLSSAPTLEQIIKLISRFYCGSTITLEEKQKDIWNIYNKTGFIKCVVVRKKGQRYRFESTYNQ